MILSFCVGVKLGQSHKSGRVKTGCSRMECRGRKLGLRGLKSQGNGEDCIMRSFVICIPQQVSFGR